MKKQTLNEEISRMKDMMRKLMNEQFDNDGFEEDETFSGIPYSDGIEDDEKPEDEKYAEREERARRLNYTEQLQEKIWKLYNFLISNHPMSRESGPTDNNQTYTNNNDDSITHYFMSGESKPNDSTDNELGYPIELVKEYLGYYISNDIRKLSERYVDDILVTDHYWEDDHQWDDIYHEIKNILIRKVNELMSNKRQFEYWLNNID